MPRPLNERPVQSLKWLRRDTPLLSARATFVVSSHT